MASSALQCVLVFCRCSRNIHSTRGQDPHGASNMARERAPSTKNVYMTWNTCNKRKKRLMNVIVRLVSSLFDSARITYSSRRCLVRSSTLPSFMKAHSSKKRWWQFLSTRFVARSGVPRGIAEKKSTVRQVQHQVVLRHDVFLVSAFKESAVLPLCRIDHPDRPRRGSGPPCFKQ